MKCQIEGCNNDAERSLSRGKLGDALTKEKLTSTARKKERRIRFCKEHYRRVKKHIKKADKLKRLRYV